MIEMADELDEIRGKEEDNYQISVRLLRDSVSLVQDIVEQYKLLADVSSKSKLVARNEFITALHFMLAARYHLTIGALAVLRTHITDALRSGRMAIELAAFAARVKRQPDLAMVWLNAGQDEASTTATTRSSPAKSCFQRTTESSAKWRTALTVRPRCHVPQSMHSQNTRESSRLTVASTSSSTTSP
jgi:hypothetical protein